MHIGLGDGRLPSIEDGSEENGADTQVHLDFGVQEVIGAALKDYCKDIIQAPVPDKFLSLLAKLEAEERSKDRAQ